MKRTMMVCLALAVLGAGERASAQFVPRPIFTGRPIGPMVPIGGLPRNLGLGQGLSRQIEFGRLDSVLPPVENLRVDFGPGSARSNILSTQSGSHSPTPPHHHSQRDASRQQTETSVRSVPSASNRETTDEKSADNSQIVVISSGGEQPDEEDDQDDDEGTNWWLWLIVALAVAIIASKMKG